MTTERQSNSSVNRHPLRGVARSLFLSPVRPAPGGGSFEICLSEDLKIGQELAKHVFGVCVSVLAKQSKWLISCVLKWCLGQDSNLEPID